MVLEIVNSINKDILIIILLSILILCLVYIRKLKKQLSFEIFRRLYPQLICELITDAENDEQGLYLKNESFFMLKDIKIEDTTIALTDSGFRQELTLRFDQIDFLKSKGRIKVRFKAFDKKNMSLPDITKRIIPHLLSISFPLRIRYANVEGRFFQASFIKKRDKFYSKKIEIVE